MALSRSLWGASMNDVGGAVSSPQDAGEGSLARSLAGMARASASDSTSWAIKTAAAVRMGRIRAHTSPHDLEVLSKEARGTSLINTLSTVAARLKPAAKSVSKAVENVTPKHVSAVERSLQRAPREELLERVIKMSPKLDEGGRAMMGKLTDAGLKKKLVRLESKAGRNKAKAVVPKEEVVGKAAPGKIDMKNLDVSATPQRAGVTPAVKPSVNPLAGTHAATPPVRTQAPSFGTGGTPIAPARSAAQAAPAGRPLGPPSIGMGGPAPVGSLRAPAPAPAGGITTRQAMIGGGVLGTGGIAAGTLASRQPQPRPMRPMLPKVGAEKEAGLVTTAVQGIKNLAKGTKAGVDAAAKSKALIPWGAKAGIGVGALGLGGAALYGGVKGVGYMNRKKKEFQTRPYRHGAMGVQPWQRTQQM